MVQVTRTYLVDDIDGSEDDVTTVRFSAEKVDYEIDLSPANEARLRDKLAKFVDAATEVKAKSVALRPVPRKRGGKAPVGREQAQAVRDWARGQGLTVSERGRIAATVQQAFDAAH